MTPRVAKVVLALGALTGVSFGSAERADAETFRVTSENAYGSGSFTAAVKEANADPERDRIVFERRADRVRVPGRVEVTGGIDVVGLGSGRNPDRASETVLVASRRQASIRFRPSDPHVLFPDLSFWHIRLERIGIVAAIGDIEGHDTVFTGRGRVDVPGIDIRSRSAVRLDDTVLTGFTAGLVGSPSWVRVRRTTIARNRGGGGIAVRTTRGSQRVSVWASLISGNVKRARRARGAGVAVRGPGRIWIGTSTLAENRAVGARSRGGAVYGSASISSATIANNSAATGGGVFLGPNRRRSAVKNSVLANNRGGNCGGTGDFTHGGNVLDDDGDRCGFGRQDLLGTDPKLEGLDDNGGLTRTMALRPGSPAVDFAIGPTRRDQRGYRRSDPDSGAFELTGSP